MTAQRPGDATVIEVVPNGPYRVSGPCGLRDSRGKEMPARATFVLCRCGNSSNKPHCGGTHAKIGFYGARSMSAWIPISPRHASISVVAVSANVSCATR